MGGKRRIVIGVTGASGAIYAQRLIEKLARLEELERLALIVSASGEGVWQYELNGPIPEGGRIARYDNSNLFAPPASGSAGFHGMAIIPCTMGTLGRLAHGSSSELIARAADVMLKERKPLVLVLREAPYSLIHIESMRLVTLAGGIILPASPSFYSRPQGIEDLVDTIVDRVVGMLGFERQGFSWAHGEPSGGGPAGD